MQDHAFRCSISFTHKGFAHQNRFIKTITYEGISNDGIPDERLFDLHASMAADDVVLTAMVYGDKRIYKASKMFNDLLFCPTLTRLMMQAHQQRVLNAQHEGMLYKHEPSVADQTCAMKM